jgi:flagellar biosynthesis protein FlhG
MQIIPIASGKGGVGKSLIAANLAIALGQAGKKVYLADLDLGGSNLHMILGVRPRNGGLGTFLNRPDMAFTDILTPTDYPNLTFIPGDAEIPGAANLSAGQKHRIIRSLLNLQADYLILDLGAGTHFNILDFFLISRRGIIVTTPTPTAAVNAYLFMKNAVFRVLTSSFKKGSAAHGYLEGLKKDGAALQRVYIPQLIQSIKAVDPEGFAAYAQGAVRFRPRLILNMLEDPEEADKANKLRRSCREYLDIDMEHLGVIYRDDMQDIALQSRLPIIIYKPHSVLSQALYRIADKIIGSESEEEGAFIAANIDESYQTAEIEAGLDFEAKIDYLEELLQAGSLSMGDLIETIKSQQFEINRLKKENQFFKSKIVKSFSG